MFLSGGMNLFFALFFLVFLLVFGMIIYSIIKGIAANRRNNASPVLDVQAKVVSKRMAYSGDSTTYDAGNMPRHSPEVTAYWVTFQFPSGDRMELAMQGNEYGLLAEGDEGTLRFQGTRYLGFAREK